MIHHSHTHRRADRGTLIVRASVVAAGLAASAELRRAEPMPNGPASWTAGDPSALCTVDASGSFAFQ
jgi:hypothetical protein